MGVEEKIKEELLKEVFTDIDKLYDFVEQRFVLDDVHEKLIVNELNKLKDQFYFVSKNSRLS